MQTAKDTQTSLVDEKNMINQKSTQQSHGLAYQSINEQSMLNLIDDKPQPNRMRFGKKILPGLNNSVILPPNSTRNGGDPTRNNKTTIFQSLRVPPKCRSPLPGLQQTKDDNMGTMWSKNGRPIKKPKKNEIESGSVVLVDKQADKMLNQKNVQNLEQLVNPNDFTSPVVNPAKDNEVQKVVVDTNRKKVPADLKHIQDQGSQEITPMIDSQGNDPL